MSIFKRVTTLQRINDQIYAAEKALLEHQGTADHYLALADGNRKTLARLRTMREAETKPVPVEPHVDESPAFKVNTKTKVKLAAAV
jgi:hypothetical protein